MSRHVASVASIASVAGVVAFAGSAGAASHDWTETIGRAGARDARSDRLERARDYEQWVALPPARATANVGDGSTGPIVQLSAPASDRITLPGGTFLMGSTAGEMEIAVLLCRREVFRALCDSAPGRTGVSPYFRAEGLAHEVRISPFALDRHEVTVGAYRRCVASGACSTPGFTPGDPRFDRDELPVVMVTWDDAGAYCRWTGKGGRLPTEAEWELAAKGPGGPSHEGARLFPWGQTYNSHLANHGAFSRDETDSTDGFRDLAPVGSFPDGATPDGILDLAGNAGEWVSDLYDRDEEGFGYAPASVLDPKGSATGVFHVVRGGAYTDGAAWMRTTSRWLIESPRSASVGFRCAADVGPRERLTSSETNAAPLPLRPKKSPPPAP